VGMGCKWRKNNRVDENEKFLAPLSGYIYGMIKEMVFEN
jgi:hypothetical protein